MRESTTTAIAALGFAARRRLERERISGFPSARHRMVFPHNKGFTGTTESQVGDVFARAIIADSLCDARDTGATGLDATLNAECSYLVDRRQPNGIGAWSYFPDLPELPPDLDVLAQVMQVLIRCRRLADLRIHVEPPLASVLRDGVRANGAIATWMIPAHNRSNAEARQARFVETAWGDTEDVEVIANFLYALAIYGRNRFSRILRDGCCYIEGRQDDDGAWRSAWYVGPYYGTYVCARALAAMGCDAALGRARAFLFAAQRDDGGWGKGLLCSQLGTALAICAICTIAERIGKTSADHDRTENAVAALAASHASQGWHATPFIRMDVGRPREELGPELFYRSSAITAAYVLKAVAAVQRMTQPSDRTGLRAASSAYNRPTHRESAAHRQPPPIVP
jgi:squalene-hopene/tetraprenyl-beta-curcumene cyclase